MNDCIVHSLYTQRYSEALKNELIANTPYYHDNLWQIKEEYQDKCFNLSINKDSFGKHLNQVKCFILLHFEAQFSFSIIRYKLEALRWVAENSDFETIRLDDLKESNVYEDSAIVAIRDFILFTQTDNNLFIEDCKYAKIKCSNPREVVSFDTMYKLDDAINEFYETAPDELLAYFFPIILWWKIGSVIPLRSSEMTLFKKGCVRYDEDNYTYILSVPDIKNSHCREPQYSEIAITDELANIIFHYETLVNEEREYLISNAEYSARHPRRLDKKRTDVKKTVNRENLQVILNEFYNEVLANEFEIAPKGTRTNRAQLEKIDLGDLRHYAMYNLVASGLDPYTIMQFARHSNVSIQTSYYGHIYSMSVSKIEILADKITHLCAGGIKTFKPESMDTFENREIQLLNLEREANDTGVRNPVVGGYCMNGYQCTAGCECITCPYFMPDDESANAKAIINYRYNEELAKLSDVCEAMKAVYMDEGNYYRLASLANEREFIVNKLALIKAKGGDLIDG